MSWELPLGLAIVALVLFDVFQSVLVPQWTSDRLRLSPGLLQLLWLIWRSLARLLPAARARESFYGSFAAFSLVATLLLWTLLLIAGYGLALYALRDSIRPAPVSLADACYFAGVSLFSLGYGDMVAEGRFSRLLAVTASGTGLAVTAMVIGLIFNLHSAVGRREMMVLTLASRAGVPPSGVELLETYGSAGRRDSLPRFFEQWERWVADLMQSHRPFHQLAYFRSSYSGESWVASLGALMDAAVLAFTTIETSAEGSARSLHSLSLQVTAEMRAWFVETDSRAEEESREEWEAARGRLKQAGYSLRPTEEAWRLFTQARAMHAGDILALARHFQVDPPSWLHGRPARVLPDRGQSRKKAGGAQCAHFDQVRDVTPGTTGCLECLEENQRWVELRLCMTCGHVGCCDSSRHQHARRHFQETGHPIIRSFEPGQEWAWCWIDEREVALSE